MCEVGSGHPVHGVHPDHDGLRSERHPGGGTARSAPPEWSGEERRTGVLGDGSGRPVQWHVMVHPNETGSISRTVTYCELGQDPDTGAVRCAGGSVPWESCRLDSYWKPERTIWPAWGPSAAPDTSVPTGLDRVENYWGAAADRLRSSAKWMATVIGLAVAALIGTSPLAEFAQEPVAVPRLLIGLGGLLLLFITLALVTNVLRPQATDLLTVQRSPYPGSDSHGSRYADDPAGIGRVWWRIRGRFSAVGRWRRTVESEQDLWLPSGVKCLVTLRQAMIVDELTVMALARALGHTRLSGHTRSAIREAQDIRTGRLQEWRSAAARIVIIAEYHRLRRRSWWATVPGGVIGFLGTVAVIAAFTMPDRSLDWLGP